METLALWMDVDFPWCVDQTHSAQIVSLRGRARLKRRLESNRIMLKEQTELKEALAQAKGEVPARAKEQATDENKFNGLYHQREISLYRAQRVET